MAQMDTDFSGGGAVRVGDSTSTCDSATAGAIRYDADGTNLVGFCDGSTWLDFVTSSVSGVVNNGNSFAAPMIIGTNDANILQFETGGTTHVTIDTAGNVGVGTTSPGQALDVRGFNSLPASSGSTQNGALRVSSTGTTMTLDAGVHSGSGAWIQATQRNLLNNSFNLLLNPNGGDVGIGTTDPAGRLEVQSATNDDTSSALILKNSSANNILNARSDGKLIVGNVSDPHDGLVAIGHASSPTYPSIGTWGGAVHILPSGGINGNTASITFGANASGGVEKRAEAGLYVQSSDAYGTRMHLATTNSYATGSQARLSIMEDGKVGIGTSTPAVELDVGTGSINAAEICDENNANCLDLSAGAGGGGYSAGDTILFADGTGANPGLAFNSDPDTGIFTQGSGEIRYSINGGNIATLDGGGFVSWGGLMADNGDATTPDFRFGLDPNTGMFSPAPDTIGFSTGGNEALTIASSGYVGVNEPSPTKTLQVGGDFGASSVEVYNASAGASLTAMGAAADAYNYSYLNLANTANSNQWSLAYRNGTTIGADANKLMFNYFDGSTYNDFLTLDPSGNIGIGTTAPWALLQIEDSGDAPLIAFTSPSNLNGGLIIGSDATSAYIDQVENEPLFIMTNDTTRMTILAGGDVGIGTSSPSYKLHVNGSVAGVGAYNNLSDRRLKRDIASVENALDKLLQINGVLYNWRRDDYQDYDFPSGHDMGVIAQDVQKVFPEAVSQSDQGLLSVAYSKLIAPIIEAIRELNSRLQKTEKTLQLEVSELKASQQLNATQKDAEIQKLKKDLEQKNEKINLLLERIEIIEKRLSEGDKN